jgi:hypothetical protein
MDEVFSMFSFIFQNIVNQNSREESILIEAKYLSKTSFPDSDEDLYHSNRSNQLVRDEIQSNSSLNIFIGAEERFSCLENSLSCWNQSLKQNLRPYLHRGGPIYTKSGIFDFNEQGSFLKTNVTIEVIFIMLAPAEVNSNPTAKLRRTRQMLLVSGAHLPPKMDNSTGI